MVLLEAEAKASCRGASSSLVAVPTLVSHRGGLSSGCSGASLGTSGKLHRVASPAMVAAASQPVRLIRAAHHRRLLFDHTQAIGVQHAKSAQHRLRVLRQPLALA